MTAPSQDLSVKKRFPFLDTDTGMTCCADDKSFKILKDITEMPGIGQGHAGTIALRRRLS